MGLENLFAQEIASIPPQTWSLLALTLLISSVGFYRTVYFISVGYAFSITGMAIASALIFPQNLSWYSMIHALSLAFYGLRLGFYLVLREQKTSYGKEVLSGQGRTAFQRGLVIWLAVSLLYVAMFSPQLFGISQPTLPDSPILVFSQGAGALIMLGGLTIETIADKQKSDFKAKSPRLFCDTGLYRIVRYPNYLGEITFWVGNFLMGLIFYTSVLRWVIALMGVICIVLIMMGSTKRLERSQGERYGNLKEYQDYTRTVPVLFPFVPIYSMKDIRVYLE